MAQLTLDLAQFKSAGVYTLEIDDTTSYTVDTNALRLLVGFSAKGPFNKPVFLRNPKDARTIFGEINEKLEHKGSYFNRFAETLSSRTPLFALNLLKVDETVQGPDQVNFASLSLDAGAPNPEVHTFNKTKYGELDYNEKYHDLIYGEGVSASGIPYVGNTAYASLFDRSRFWEPSDENLLATAAKALETTDTLTFENTNFLNFANVGTSEMSLLVFKPENLNGYSITCEEWFGGRQNIPYGFIRPNDYVEDYFIQVVAVKGNWTNYDFLSVDVNWADYFDEKGIKKNKINSFISSAGVTLIGSWIGSIIPNFQNKAGEFVDIINKINVSTTTTGLLASFNKDAANVLAFDYDGEFIADENGDGEWDESKRGWFIDNDGDREWNGQESAAKTFLIDMVGHNFQEGYKTRESFDTDVTEKGEDDKVITFLDNVKRYGINFLSYTFDAKTPEDVVETIKNAQLFNKCAVVVNDLGVEGTYGPVKEDMKNMFIVTDKKDADKLAIGDLVNNDKEDKKNIPGLTKIIKKSWVNVTLEDETSADNLIEGTMEVSGATFIYKGETFKYSGQIYNDKNFAKKGFYLFTAIENVELKEVVAEDEPDSGSGINYSANGETVLSVTKQHKISDSIISKNLKFIPLKGLSITKRHMPGYDVDGNVNSEAGVEKIYSMLADDGIIRGLKNQQMINFRYVIDSMSHGIGPMMGGKVYLSQLAKKRGSCTAILNVPSKREFARSANPYFCDTFVNGIDIRPAFNTEYIPLGGNDEIYSENKFTLPDEDNGATFTAAFFPNLVYNYRGRKVTVPPAADVANVLVRKFTGSDMYMICANNNGIITNSNLAGVEFALDTQDRDALEPFGINPIISRDGDVMIYGNQTCYQRVKSDLNKLHIRENLNTLEIAVNAVLQNYVFLYNNPQTRANIVQRITPIMQAAQTSGAIESFTIQCDENNNTEEIISSDFGVVDITLVMNHGMEKIVSRFTLKRNDVSQT